MNPRRVLARALRNPAALRFAEVCALAEGFGFVLARTRGSHHIFVHGNIAELLNLQNAKGMAKPYQVRQLLALVERYNLSLGDEG